MSFKERLFSRSIRRTAGVMRAWDGNAREESSEQTAEIEGKMLADRFLKSVHVYLSFLYVCLYVSDLSVATLLPLAVCSACLRVCASVCLALFVSLALLASFPVSLHTYLGLATVRRWGSSGVGSRSCAFGVGASVGRAFRHFH